MARARFRVKTGAASTRLGVLCLRRTPSLDRLGPETAARGSPKHPDYQGKVGATGFEPATFRPQPIGFKGRCFDPGRVHALTSARAAHPELHHDERHDQQGYDPLALGNLVEEEDVELDPGRDQLAGDR